MKKARIGKFYIRFLLLFVLSIVFISLIPIKSEAFSNMNAMTENYNVLIEPSALLTAVGDGISTATPQQTGVTIIPRSNKTLDSAIANYRTYYGRNDTLDIQVKFSKKIVRYSNVKLVIQFGDNGVERIIDVNNSNTDNNIVVNEDVLTFSYKIEEEDNGGIILNYLEGTVYDEADKSCEMAMPVGENNKWSNTIIAKGKNAGYTVNANSMIAFNNEEPMYILDDSKIRPMKESDIKVLDTNTGNLTNGTNTTVRTTKSEVQPLGVIEAGPNMGEKIVCIKNVCDIAGNKIDEIDNVAFASQHKVRIISCKDSSGNAKTKFAALGDKTYLKAGDKVTFLLVYCSKPNKHFLYIGDEAEDKRRDLYEQDPENKQFDNKEIISPNVCKRTYTIKDGENGEIYTECNFNTGGSDKNYFEHKYIVDTIAPTVKFKLTKENGSAYYSANNNAANNNNAVPLTAPQQNGTIWASKETKFKIEITTEDENGICNSYNNIGLQSIPSHTNSDHIFELERLTYNLTDNSETGDLTAKGKGKCDLEVTFTDYAGNTKTKSLTDQNITLLCDTEGPNVSITPKVTMDSNAPTLRETKEDHIIFEIKASDPGVVGSCLGVGIGIGDAVKKDDIVVTNGSIIEYSSDKNIAKIIVMPDSDGNVNVCVPKEKISDRLGNKNSTNTIKQVKYDTTAPVITACTVVPEDDWVKKATISIIANDGNGVGGIKYKFGTGAWQTSNQCEVTSSGVLNVQVMDSLGNESEVTQINITNVDSTPPTITGINYNGNWTNDDVMVSIEATDEDGSGVKEYCFGGDTWQTTPYKIYSSSATIPANTIKVRDEVGNETIACNSEVKIQIDREAPTVEVSHTPTVDTDSNVTISCTAADIGGSGVAGISFNGGAFEKNKTEWEVSSNGIYTIEVKDEAGNIKTVTHEVNNINKFNPVVTFENMGPFVKPNDAGEAKINPVINVTGESDVHIAYLLTKEEIKPNDNTVFNEKVQTQRLVLRESCGEGEYYLWAKVSDCDSQRHVYVCAAEKIRVQESSITFVPNPAEVTNANVTVKINYGDGLINKKVKIGNEDSNGVNSVTIFTNNTTIHAEATDEAGNKVWNKFTVNNIDREKPEVKITTNPTTYIATGEKTNVIAKVEVQDDHPDKLEYAWSNKADTPTGYLQSSSNASVNIKEQLPVGEWYLYVKATDKAGNVTEVCSEKITVKSAVVFDTSKNIEQTKIDNGITYIIVQPGTKVSDLLSCVTTVENKTKNVKNKSNNDVLATNDELVVTGVDNNYIVVVKGDANCDGDITIADIVKINKVKMNPATINTLPTMEKLAMDVNSDNEIDIKDIIKVNQYRLKKLNTL